jgi:DNA sulfur modification protein DndD
MSKLTEGLKSSTIHGSTKGLDPKSVKLLSNKMQSISQRIVQESDSKFEDDIVHDLSRGDIEKLLVWAGHVTGEIPKEMARYCNRLLEAKEALARIEVDLARTPSEEIVKPLMNRLQELNQELGVLKEKAKRVDDEITSVQSKLHKLEISMQKSNRVIEESEGASRRLKLVSRTQNVLAEFANSLRVTKTKELENITSDLFRKLCRKRDLIDRVAIDSSDFSISLFDKSGSQIPKKNLSSGERQIFAISILWALRKVSARPIPVIIDTPLSRLDSDHRSNLINQYFPDASHQTIILSTDTEINEGYFEGLTTSISHTYHLHYYQDQHRTVGKPGYFWKRKKKAKYELK